MIDRSRSFDTACALVLALGLILAVGPLYLALTTASHTAAYLVQHRVPLTPGLDLAASAEQAWAQADLGRKLWNSLFVCLLVTAGKLVLGFTTAYALVFFRAPFRGVGFALILLTLMLPLETRIAPTYALAADALAPVRAVAGLAGLAVEGHWTLLDTYAGLTVPTMAAATGTFLFRQVFQTLPDSLIDAAKVDGVGPWRFMIDVALPLSRGNLAALAVVTFITAWNQYLWPLLITTRPQMQTAILAIAGLAPDAQDTVPAWNVTLAGVLIVILPPLLVAVIFRRGLVRGLTTAGRA